jgi:hypothetical protein
MPIRRRAVLAFAFVALTAGVANADQTTIAEQMFDRGLEALKKEDWVTACAAFAASEKADASPGTEINLGLCHEKQKHWATAWGWYRTAAGFAEHKGQSERAVLARKEADRIKPQIHYVVMTLKPMPEGLVVKRDGEAVEIVLAGQENPIAFDPGEHTIEVTAKGKKPWTGKMKTADTPSTERFEIPPLVDAPVEAGSDPNNPGGPIVVASDGSGQRTVGIVVGGAGILAGLAAVGVYLLAVSEDSKGQDLRAQANDAKAKGDTATESSANSAAKTRFDAAKNDQLIAIICGAGGAVLLGVGAFLYLTAPKGTKTTGKPHILPTFGSGYAGLAAGGTF